MAAALAYYTIFAIAPILLIVIAVAGTILGQETVEDDLLSEIENSIGEESAEAISEMLSGINDPSNSVPATAVSIIFVIFGATGAFSHLQDSLNSIWGAQNEFTSRREQIVNVLRKRLASIALLVSLGLLLVASVALSTTVSVMNDQTDSVLLGIVRMLLQWGLSLAVLTTMFMLIFRILPDKDISWQDVWLGAFVTAILFLVGQSILSFYLSEMVSTSAYGAAGALIIVLLWIYYTTLILLAGAEFTTVYAHTHGGKQHETENLAD